MGGSKIAGSPMGGAISSIGGAVGQIGGSLIGGGLESGAGSAISNIGGTIGGVSRFEINITPNSRNSDDGIFPSGCPIPGRNPVVKIKAFSQVFGNES